jgi:hypothetical protein
MSKELDCITLWAPWANWVSLRWKTIETRTHSRFAGLVGKRIGIHAGLFWDATAIAQALPYLSPERIELSKAFPRVGGNVLCTAMVSEQRWLTAEDSPAALIDCGSVRRHGLFLTDIRSLPACEETYVKGRQGKFTVSLPDHLLAA